MLFLAGWGKNLKKLSDAGLSYCTNCHNTALFDLVELHRKVSLFLVPVAKWDSKFYKRCSICDAGYELTEQEKNTMLGLSMKLPSNIEIMEIWNDIDKLCIDFLKTNQKPEDFNNYIDDKLSSKYNDGYISYVLLFYKDNLERSLEKNN
ncbi:zinc-ribbon domain-containing protein [Candidatus Nomurabacteria bacterium]|nr:zinc-ribbon domain-containing protein [Candidatus Nomurabacteria bacterium]